MACREGMMMVGKLEACGWGASCRQSAGAGQRGAGSGLPPLPSGCARAMETAVRLVGRLLAGSVGIRGEVP